MRKFAITGIVLVLLVVSVGAGLTLRAAQAGSAAATTGTTGGGGGPGLFPFAGRVGGGGGGGGASNAASQSTVVDQGDVALTINATGHVVTKQQTNLSFQQSGSSSSIVKAVNVQIGQKVKAGDVLAILDNLAQQTSLTKTENSLKATQGALDKLLQP